LKKKIDIPVIGQSKLDLPTIKGEVAKKTLSYNNLWQYCKLNNLEYSFKGFIDVNIALPQAYDIVKLKMNNSEIRTGWFTGNGFYCRKQKANEEIVKWKKNRIAEIRN